MNEADLPAGEREDLTGRADLDRALPHPRQAHQRNVTAAVEHHVLPDLVADGDRVEAAAEIRQQGEILPRKHRRARVERVVEEDDPRPLGEGFGERRFVQAEPGRLERDEARHAAGPAHQRQVGVVHRLEQHDLVARSHQGHQGAGQGLRSAGGHHHLVLGIEIETLVVP